MGGNFAAAAVAAKEAAKEAERSQPSHPKPDLYEVYGSVANFNGAPALTPP